MDLHCEMIMDEYRRNKPVFDIMKDVVLNNIKDLVWDSGLLVAVCEGRVKEEKSLAGKLELKGYKYGSLDDITDILGVRIVTFYTDHVDKIASLLEKAFEIDWNESVDKRKMLANDQFGYMSLHYICRIPGEMYFDEKHPEINRIRFEIQLRTTLQHEWATAFHDTGYKSDIEVPREYIRALNRLAGLLELADEQFSSIMNSLSDYRRRVTTCIRDGNFEDLELNGDTFRSYLDTRPFDLLNRKIAAVNRAEITEVNLMPYLEPLRKLGMETLEDVDEMKRKYSEDAYSLALSRIGSTDIDIVASNIGLINLCVVYAIKEKGEAWVYAIADDIFGEGEKGRHSADRILKQARAINLISELPEK